MVVPRPLRMPAAVAVLLAVAFRPILAEEAPLGAFTRGAVDRLAIPRGPIETRDEYLLAQPRLTLPACSPDPMPCGVWQLDAQFDWGNDFGFSQAGPAEDPRSDRRFLVDGEHRTLSFTLRRAVRPDLDLALRVPLQWRGTGILDPLIDVFHKVTGTLDNARPEFFQNKYRIQGRDAQGNRFDWNDDHGTGLGNVELAVRWAFLRPRRPQGLRAAFIGRLGLPTGTGPFATGSVDVGAQLVAARRLARRWDVYGGAGGTLYTQDEIDGLHYERLRGYGFLTLEYRVFPWLSVTLQSDVSSRLVQDVVDFPSLQWYVQLGFTWDMGDQTRLLFGFTENLQDQQSTADVSGWVGIQTRF